MAEVSNKNILVVEDDSFLMKAYQIKFGKEGMGVLSASDGKEALEMLQKEPAEAVLLDLMLPQVSGFDVLAAIRKNDKWKNVPVIILSNLGGEQDIERGKELGATDYIVKANTKIDDVVKKVKEYIK